MAEGKTFKIRDKESGKTFTVREKSAPTTEAVKLNFPEKIMDRLSGGMIREGKEFRAEAATGSMGENAQALAKGGEALESTAKTVGQIGQSIIAGTQTANILSKVPVLAKQKLIQGLVSSAETKIANQGIRLSNIQRAAQKYAIEGAVAVQPFDYKNLEDRIKTTAISAAITPLMGLSIEGGMDIASRVMRTARKFKASLSGVVSETTSGSLRDPRMPAIKRVRESLLEAERQGSEIGQSSRRQIIESNQGGKEFEAKIKERADLLRGNISSEAKSQQQIVKGGLKEAESQINRSIDYTDSLLSKESDIAAKSYQSKVGKFFRENSEIYGKQLDKISDTIGANGRMTRQEAFNVLQNTVKKSATEAEVLEGEVIQKINNLIQTKYNPATNITDPKSGTVYRDMNELIPFNEFLGELRDIWGSVYKKGGRMVQDDIPAAILKGEFGELVSTLPGGEDFKSLQSAYRPVISYMNKANSVLQPYKGEAYTKTAEMLVKRYAKGGAAESDKQLIDFIENGTERFAKGVGALSGRARQLGENIKTLSNEMGRNGQMAEKRILEIAKEGADKISRINMVESDALTKIQNETNRRSFSILQEAAEHESKTWARAKQLRGREMDIENLTGRMQKLKGLSAGTIKLLAGLTSGYLVLRGGSEIVNTIAKEQ